MRSFKRLLTSYWFLCSLLTLILLVASLVDYPALRKLDLPIYDQLVSLRSTSLNRHVVLLAIDQQSRQSLGETARSRKVLTVLLQKLDELGVQQVGLLTALSFPTGTATLEQEPASQKQSLRHNNLSLLQEALEVDRALTERLNAVRPALPLELRSTAVAKEDTLSGTNSLALLKPMTDPRKLLLDLKNPLAGYRFNRPDQISFLTPDKTFKAAKLPLGHQVFPVDPDGKIRSQLLLLPSQGRLVASLSLQMALRSNHSELKKLQIGPRELPGTLQSGDWQISTGRDYRQLLDISGQGLPFQRYSVSELLKGTLDDEKLHEKIVLIGTIDSSGDHYRLATRGELSSSELSALATASLLTGSQLQRPFWSWQVESLALLYFAVILLLLIPRLSFRAGFITLCLFLVSWLTFAAVELVLFGFWLQVAPAMLLCGLGFFLVRWDMAQQHKQLSMQESDRLLALSFQEQGLLDLALEKFLRIPPKDRVIKEMLYNLGLDFERKRMPHKALTTYRHLLQGGGFRDVRKRLKQLEGHSQTVILPAGDDRTLVLGRPGEKPTLGRYRIEKELGQGGMGTVYLGSDPKINRQVAIKTLEYQQVEPDQLPLVKERFFREAEAAGRLNHPQIVTIYDVGEENDLAYLAMELLDGQELSSYCQAGKLLPVPRVIGLLAQIARALDYAHGLGVVHRDIKPSNIIVLKDWQIKVADFGVARVMSSTRTETGVILGTPSYMSPEQVAGKKVDGRSDLFSLGVVMYELLSGKKPFQGDSMAALMYNVSKCNYRPLREVAPSVPKACHAILGRLLLKGVSRRFKSAAALATELETLQQTLEPR